MGKVQDVCVCVCGGGGLQIDRVENCDFGIIQIKLDQPG